MPFRDPIGYPNATEPIFGNAGVNSRQLLYCHARFCVIGCCCLNRLARFQEVL
jgi:hypothetical protein